MEEIKELISIPFASEDEDDLNYYLTVNELNALSEEIVDKGIYKIKEALEKAGLEDNDLDLIVLAGGSSQLPLVYEKIKDEFNTETRIIANNLMLAISYGASLYQRELAMLPKLGENIKNLGYSLGLSVSEGDKTSTQIIFNYDEVLPAKFKSVYSVDLEQEEIIIRLISCDGINNEYKKELNRRVINLPENHSDKIIVEITVDKNKLIELVAYDPKMPDIRQKITVDKQLTDEEKKKYRKKLGLTTDGNKKYLNNVQQPFIGIDLGTTTSEVSYVNRTGEIELNYIKNPKELTSEYSEYCFPSVVLFGESKDENYVSDARACNAKQDVRNEGRVFSEYKVEDVNKNIGRINGEAITVKDLSTIALHNMWESAKDELSNPNLKKAVITVPASFSPDQCTMTYEAAKCAGIDEVTLIDEPTAAFLYYRQELAKDNFDFSGIKNVLVFDFGGGTTDVAILDVKTESDSNLSYKEQIFTVLASVGSNECGGKFVDEAIFNYIKDKFIRETHSNINKRAAKELRSKVEEIKVKLSEAYAEQGEI